MILAARESQEVPIVVERDGKELNLKIKPELRGTCPAWLKIIRSLSTRLVSHYRSPGTISTVLEGGPVDGKLKVGDETQGLRVRLNEEQASYPAFAKMVSTKGSLSNKFRQMVGLESMIKPV